ncbi:MAG TPA: MobA/MobL family protein [Steroidobacteraceae bacterium]|nr:MobA/MobL family protein [Steroidobacteraceae bacterium]
MAVYFLRSKHLSRGKGARATRAAAYRAGERIRDERTSDVHDFSDRQDVAYKEVIIPHDLSAAAEMSWTQDRSTLWNAAEHAGLRRNSRVAREWLVLLPPELTPGQRTQLVRAFAADLANRYRCAVDLSIHQPRPGADSRNHHAHLLMTTREVTPDGFGPRTSLELGGRERHLMGLAGTSRDEYLSIRERWAQFTNEALRQAGLDARVDHRSFEKQGINREPTPTIPEKVFYAERAAHGHSAAGDEIRSRHRERLDARIKGKEELTRVLQKQKAELRERAIDDAKRREAQPEKVRWSALTREDRNKKRREKYQHRRATEKLDAPTEAKRREAARQRYYARMQRDPEAIREARRRWRSANAEKINRQQREYRQKRAERSQSSSPSPEDSANRWKAAYGDNGAPGPSAEESARNWLAFHEREGLADPTAPHMSVQHLEGTSASAEPDDDDDRKPRKRHDHDLEM